MYKEECIIWDKYISKEGYGKKKHKGKMFLAHRLAYCKANELELEDIKGLLVRHKCDVRACVNPLHLETGSYTDNLIDAITRGRRTDLKLTLEKAREVRYMKRLGYKQKDIAEVFGVSKATISEVINGKCWKDPA